MNDQKVLNIYQKLLTIQTELKVTKNQRNSFGNYNYRSAEDILEASKPLCAKHEVLINLTDEVVLIGDRYYVKAHAKLLDIVSGDFADSFAYAREEEQKKGMDGAQITGAASSYARKYALNGLFAIDDNKDADTDEHKNQTDKADKVKETKATKQQLDEIKKIFTELQIPLLLKRANVSELEDLSITQASNYIKKMQEAQATA